MMRQMRENTKWIMLVTALAFVALMVFEWGMDMTGQSAGGVGEIGRVNGSPVYYDPYMNTYRSLYDQVQRNQGEAPITSQQNREIEDAAFDEVVNQLLIQQELDRRGIVVSDDELRQAAQLNPPPEFRQDPTFLTDGRFDLAKYQTFLSSADETFLLSLEAYYRDIIPRSKLLQQVSAGVYVSDAELWQQFRDRNERVEVRYIPLDPATRIADEDVQLTEAEIEAYYRDNEDQFEEPARAQVKVTVLGKTPTAADTAASRDETLALLQELEAGAEFGELARLESTDAATAADGGSLGVFPRGQNVPAFDSAVFAARPGDLVGPVETPFGYHLIDVQDRWGQDSARARHILIPIDRTDDSEIALLNRADSLENLGEQMALEEAAGTLGLEVQTTELTSQFAFVAGAGQVSEGADWAFEEAEVGDVSPVFETPQAFYSLELVSRTPAGILPLAAARPAIEQTLYFEKKQAQVAEEGQTLAEQIRAGEPLPNVAAESGLQVRGAGPFARGEFVPGLGRYNAAIGAAFGLEVGEVSDVVATPANSFIVEVMDRTPADSLAWVEQKAQQRAQLLPQLRQQRLEAWLEGLRENARIVDRRAQVLQPADEQPLRQQSPFGF